MLQINRLMNSCREANQPLHTFILVFGQPLWPIKTAMSTGQAANELVLPESVPLIMSRSNQTAESCSTAFIYQCL